MAENKTIPTISDVTEFINSVADETRRNDSFQLVEIIQEITYETPVMWGANIIGFGSYHYKSKSCEGDYMKIGFSPRKEHLVLYGVIYYSENTELLDQLGKHKQGKGCLYIKKLSDINLDILKQMISDSYAKPAQGEVTNHTA